MGEQGSSVEGHPPSRWRAVGHDGLMTADTRDPASFPRRRRVSARSDILDAAGALFTTLGFAGTSTRAIAEAAGIRQASLYHHFTTKVEIACALLNETVTPTLTFIPFLLGTKPALTPTEHVHALAMFDGDQLLNRRWNLGALYLQPELRGPGLKPFWEGHDRLRWHYLTISQAIAVENGIHKTAAQLPFRLVESLVNLFDADPGEDRDVLPAEIADACVRVLGVENSAIHALRTNSIDVIARFNCAGATAVT